MKNTYFSAKIFRQGIRVIRLPWIILGVIALVLSLLQTVSSMISIQTMIENSANPSYDTSYYDMLFSLQPITLSAFAALGSLILTLCAFSFLRKRRSSDIYHSVPVNRACLFFSYTLSVVAVVVVTILVIISANFAVAFISGHTPSQEAVSTMLLQNGRLLADSLSVIFATVLVMSVTGTLFGNLTLSAVLLYLPGIVISLYSSAISSATGNLIFASGGFYGGSGLMQSLLYSPSMLFYYPPYLATSSRYYPHLDTQAGWMPVLQALILCAVYFAAALLLFVKRKSEMAGPGISSPVIQHISRIAVTLPFIAYFPVAFLSKQYFNLTALVTLGALALIAYFSFEIITTRRFRALIKALPMFFVVIGIVILSSLGLYGVKQNILAFTPQAGEVDSIRIKNIDTYGYNLNFNLHSIENIIIKDSQINEILCNNLKKAVQEVRLADLRAAEEKDYNEVSRNVSVEFDTGLFKKTRNLTFTDEEYKDLILKFSESSKDFQKALTTLPENDEIDVSSMALQGNIMGSFESKEIFEIYKIFRREYAALSYNDKLKIINIFSPAEYSEETTTLNFAFRNENGNYFMEYYIFESLTPETYKEAMSKRNLKKNQRVWDLFKQADQTGIDINIYKNEDGSTLLFAAYGYTDVPEGMPRLSQDDFKLLMKIVSSAILRAEAVENAYNMNLTLKSTEEYEHFEFYLKNEEADMLDEIYLRTLMY